MKLEGKVVLVILGSLIALWALNGQKPLFEMAQTSLIIAGFVACLVTAVAYAETRSIPLAAVGGLLIYIAFINRLIELKV